jgi:hypothetical protein
MRPTGKWTTPFQYWGHAKRFLSLRARRRNLEIAASASPPRNDVSAYSIWPACMALPS